MTKIAVIYFSKTGLTESLAQAVVKGIQSLDDTEALIYCISETDIHGGRFINEAIFDQINRCDGIIFGSPTYMGGPAAQFKAFVDATSILWVKQQWANKIAAGFTCGSGFNGDQSNTLYYFITLAAQHGMLWANLDTPYNYHHLNRLGTQLGVVAQSDNATAHPIDLQSAEYLGQRVSLLASSLHIIKKPNKVSISQIKAVKTNTHHSN
ncbi:flavodoxin family protein [Thiotrichales bacterium 19X7-9]|nr:flavodoxin family protein [Thiotrichales bacterium 19X7-9]